MEENKLPSAFQINDLVTLDFNESGKIKNCRVFRVHFTESKVHYDIWVPLVKMGECDGSLITLIENVDSICVTKNIE